MIKRRACILLFFTAFVVSAFKIQTEVEEYEAKAAFIYNFTKFVEWEDNTMNGTPSFNIGVLGESPIIRPLQELAFNKKINNKKIMIVRYKTVSEIRGCHILFIPENTQEDIIKELAQSAGLKSTLLITEKHGELESGSAINFLIVNNKIRFEINMNSLNKNKIKASSQLLKLAMNIKN
ncbi:MAG: putative transrane protein [Bacteroidota bacterium]|jgi:hypothetical protein|nr:putative transrane protein [Bacteroidota bacterium]